MAHHPNLTLEDLDRLMHHTPGCPICHYGCESGRRYIDGVMYESVNDYGLRQKLTRTMGFCAFHSQEMLTIPGAKLGAAIIEQAMLKEALSRLSKPANGRGTFFSSFSSKNQSNPFHVPSSDACPACQHEREAETRALEELLQQWDAHWLALLTQAGGLCLPHLGQAIALTSDKTLTQTLKTSHQRIWDELDAHLSEFIRKQDYRFRDEPILPAEATASRRAMAILTGEPRQHGSCGEERRVPQS